MEAIETSTAGTLLSGRTSIEAHALCLGERIDTKGLSAEVLATGPLLVCAGEAGCAAILRYGCVVLFGMTPEERRAFLDDVARLVSEPLEKPEEETLPIELSDAASERIEGGRLFLRGPDLPALQVVADALAKSVALNHYENIIAEAFRDVEPLAKRLKTTGRSGERARQLVGKIGSVLLVEHGLVGRVEVAEPPELLWEHPGLEGLYGKLESEYELGERSAALDRKLRLLVETAGIFLNLLHNRRSLRVEWYIVALIVVEIGLMLYEMARHG